MLTSLCLSFPKRLFVLLSIITMFTITGCEQSVKVLLHKTDMAVKLPHAGLQASDMHDVINQAAVKVQETLPNSTYNGLVIFGDCSGFPNIEGRVTLIFIQTERGLFGVRSYVATASVHTTKQKMDLRIVADPYWNYNPQHYDETELNRVLQAVTVYLQKRNISNCTVTLSKIDHFWRAECIRGEGNAWERVCYFEIDGNSGVISEING
ncbi:MAG: hypothetical protein ACOYNY_26745 [Caldilineaceae bacterium]